jgi:cell division protein FtsW
LCTSIINEQILIGKSLNKQLEKLLNLFKGDKTIWFIYLTLCIISLIEVFSAGSKLAYHGSYWEPLKQQGFFLIIGLFVVITVLHVPFQYFKKFLIILIPLSVFLLIWTLAKGEEVNDANRWVRILGIKFQPSEFAKMTMVIYTAWMLYIKNEEKVEINVFWHITITLGIFCFLIFTENLSTAGLLFIVIVTMMFIGGIPIKKLLLLIGGVLLAMIFMFLIIFAIVKSQPASTATPQKNEIQKREKLGFIHRAAVWVARIEDFFPSDDKKADEQKIEKSDQKKHASIAIATSSIFGKGPGNSIQRDYLSEAALDFIYAIIIEEMGLFGGALVVILYAWLLIRAGKIAQKCENSFASFLILGIALMMVSQALINMMVAVGLFPVTGQPLPLVSKGGTNLIINCIYIGMMLSVSRYARKLDKKKAKENIKVEKEPAIKEVQESAVPVIDENIKTV